MTWLLVFIAFMFGVYVGMLILAMCNVASRVDDMMEMDGDW